MNLSKNASGDFEKRLNEVFSEHYNALVKKLDVLFGFLLIFQWLLGVALAFFISPLTWSGEYSQTHIHVYAAIFLGAIIAAAPAYLALRNPGAAINRMVIAVGQILFTTLFIHLTGGRIETHFHLFGSFAMISFYRDVKPLLIAATIAAVDHGIRGIFWPQSIFGVLSAAPLRILEHGAWVISLILVTSYSIKISRKELRSVAESQIGLEEKTAQLGVSNEALKAAHDEVAELNRSLEKKVEERTEQLQDAQQKVLHQQQTLMASAKMSALGEMAGGVAHEINNPLAVIKTISEQLQEVIDDDPLDKHLIKNMAGEIEITLNRITKIVQSLRFFSRDGSKDPFDRVNVRQLIEETLSLCKERFQNDGIQIIIEDFKTDLCFDGRATEISQVLLNLLNNAFDAIFGFEKKWIRVSVVEESELLTVQITDCGNGIPTEVRSKIFQPFFTTKEIGKGTGLGLSISMGIIRGHRGELKLDEECKNTRFVIQLPKKQ